MTTHELLGKPVVGMEEGSKVGEVRDLIFDPQSLALVALSVKGDRHHRHLPWESIKGIGKDAVTIENISVLEEPPKKIEPLRSFRDLEGVPMVDGAGNTIGAVHEMVFDENGRIKTLNSRSGGVFGLGAKDLAIMADEIRSIGAKMVTVERFSPAG